MKLNVINDATKYGAWSVSKLKVAKQCGLRFHWQYVDKKKVLIPESAAIKIGNAAHKVLELTLKGQDFSSAVAEATRSSKLTTSESEDLFLFEGNIKEFLGRIQKFEIKNPVKNKLIERKFAFTADLTTSDYFKGNPFFRGAVDLAMNLEKGHLVIIDHKTGRVPTNSSDLTEHEAQLKSYAIAGTIMFPEIKGVQSAIHWLKTGEIAWAEMAGVEEIKDGYLPWFSEYINSAVSGLSREPSVGVLCKWCDYNSQCDAYQATLK